MPFHNHALSFIGLHGGSVKYFLWFNSFVNCDTFRMYHLGIAVFKYFYFKAAETQIIGN